ncbi:MarR family winged helix-turn-helix transcriptional regulator [Rhodococcus sp. ARC_M6]|uniref:MarR family winged helix-turn-helix transcriptional regulator n=1 Tax=Rhodococcus sp. ARC_M6 TaxID=2928852 RepID=UPI001FB2284D|nr:MarR family transcriptional regulator [Rhodococcus sp. ARC_M6]MCJ0905321.1 MarR family transcriptional regulator [Rhodococcus sp. ARC_M6]
MDVEDELPHRLSDDVLETLGQLRRGTRKASGRPFAERPLGGAQIELVRLLRRNPGLSVAEAATKLGVAANTVSTLVRQLADDGVIERVVDGADRRVARLALSKEARERVEYWRDRRSVVVGQALSSLSADDQAHIEAALPALTRLAVALARAGAETEEA